METEIIVLPDGRRARRERNGRCRDIASGKWISAANAAAAHSEDRQQPRSPQEHIEQAALLAAQNQGVPASSAAEVFAGVVGVQTEIALDKSKPAQATAAARFIAKQANLTEQTDAQSDSDQPWFVLGRQLALEVLRLIEEEVLQRKSAPGGETVE